MSISYRNTINTGIHGPVTGQDPLEACLPRANTFWAGIQPFGHISGIQDWQGTLGYPKWKNTDWLTTSTGSGGAPTADLTPVARTSTIVNSCATIITDDAADGDGWGIQFSMDGGTTADLPFLPTAGQLLFAYGRFKTANTSTNSRFYFGLSDANTDIHNADDDLIMFYKASGALTMVGRTAKAGTATDTSALANSQVNDAYISLGIRVNGVSSIEFWQGTLPGNMTKSATQTTMTNLPDEGMALSFHVETSAAASVTATLQHMVACQEAL